jgi:protein phosphatase 2C family protein 2/3
VAPGAARCRVKSQCRMGAAASIGVDDANLTEAQKAELFTHLKVRENGSEAEATTPACLPACCGGRAKKSDTVFQIRFAVCFFTDVKAQFEEHSRSESATESDILSKLKVAYALKAKTFGAADAADPATATALADPAGPEPMEVVQLEGGISDEDAARQAEAFAAKMGSQINLSGKGEEEAAEANGKGNSSDFRKRRLSLTQAKRGQAKVPLSDRRSSTVMYRSQEMDSQEDIQFPFGEDKVGTYSCHGVEPSFYEEEGVTAKINQDRACVVYPFAEDAQQALFMVLDGHGESGEVISHFVMHELQAHIEKHPMLEEDPELALRESFLAVDEALGRDHASEATFSGTTVVAVLMRGTHLWIANAGDSRAVLAQLKADGLGLQAKDLSEDQNPNSPAEQERILASGGFVSPPPEPGLSARVWLDAEMTQIGLAMARSIGDHAVKKIGVIAEPEIRQHTVSDPHPFFCAQSGGSAHPLAPPRWRRKTSSSSSHPMASGSLSPVRKPLILLQQILKKAV